MSHRRALDERLAPWALMAVILFLWWGGARLAQWSGLADRLRQQADGVVRDPRGAPDTARRASRESFPPPPPDPAPARYSGGARPPAPTTSAGGSLAVTFQDIVDLRNRALTIPVEGVTPEALVSSYGDRRDDTRPHEAIDIMAPRGTSVIAAGDGRVARLFTSVRGGLTIYQFDSSDRFAYYYAHLDAYAPGLREGDLVRRGQTLGVVGTTGNAPPGAPHLHFAIFKLGPARRWWEGTPVDPFLIWR